MKIRHRSLAAVVALLACAAGLLVLDRGLPYGREHRKFLEAHKLAGSARMWSRGSAPGDYPVRDQNVFRTNLAYEGELFEIVARSDRPGLGNGFLVATKAGTVFWLQAGTNASLILVAEEGKEK